MCPLEIINVVFHSCKREQPPLVLESCTCTSACTPRVRRHVHLHLHAHDRISHYYQQSEHRQDLGGQSDADNGRVAVLPQRCVGRAGTLPEGRRVGSMLLVLCSIVADFFRSSPSLLTFRSSPSLVWKSSVHAFCVLYQPSAFKARVQLKCENLCLSVFNVGSIPAGERSS